MKHETNKHVKNFFNAAVLNVCQTKLLDTCVPKERRKKSLKLARTAVAC